MRPITAAMAQRLHELRQRLHPDTHDTTERFEDCVHCTHNKTGGGLIPFRPSKEHT